MFISNSSSSASASAYLGLCRVKQCISIRHGMECIGCQWGLQRAKLARPLWKVPSDDLGFACHVFRGL